jgi:hypothetical protein
MSALAVVAAVSRRHNDHKAKEYSYNQAALHLLLYCGLEACTSMRWVVLADSFDLWYRSPTNLDTATRRTPEIRLRALRYASHPLADLSARQQCEYVP